MKDFAPEKVLDLAGKAVDRIKDLEKQVESLEKIIVKQQKIIKKQEIEIKVLTNAEDYVI